MGKDYYSILSIERTSTQAEIRKAYHRKALQYHPDKSNTNDGTFFSDVAEAYDVLSSANKRKIFDSLGEEGLKNRCNYQFMADPMKIFQEIFFDNNASRANTNKRPRMSMYSSCGRTTTTTTTRCTRSPPTEKQKDKPVIKDLRVSLEELHVGLTKRIKITKKIESTTYPNKYKMEEKILEIKIRPGWKDGTRVTFENEGNISNDTVPADLVFVIREKKHPVFERRGDDLVHKTTISLKQSLIGSCLTVPTIDPDQSLDWRYTDIIKPGYERIYSQKGMRSQKDYNKRGNLIVKVIIRFPDSLTPEQQEALANILPD